MISLVGLILSHIIVLFDFIEERHADGDPLREALLDAGIIRLRPVLITVGATVIALGLVPVVYAIFVLDLKWVKWERREEPQQPALQTYAGAQQ